MPYEMAGILAIHRIYYIYYRQNNCVNHTNLKKIKIRFRIWVN